MKVFIDVNTIPQLHSITMDENSIIFGGNVSLTEMMNTFEASATKYDYFGYGAQLAKHIDLVATVAVRNVCCIS